MNVPTVTPYFLDRAHEYYGDQTGVVAADGTEYTYSDLADRVYRLANALQALGVEQGDRVAVLSPNTHWCIEALFATQHLGGIFTPLNYRLTTDDYRYLLNDCGARVVVADYEYAEKISNFRDEVPAEEFVCYESDRVEGEWLDYDDLLADASSDPPERPAIAEDDEAAINYTSGTTGDPKGVVRTHRTDYHNALTHAYNAGLRDDTVYPWTLPMFHVHGWGAMDTIIQHVSGFSSILGYPDDGRPPIRSQSSLADFYAGYNAALGTMAAIRWRDKGNGGQKVDISLLESMMHNMDGAFEYYTNLDEEPPQGGRNAFFNPDMLYGAARAADGWICVALLLYSDRVWEGFCEILDRPDLYEKDRYQDDAGRVADSKYLTGLFEDWLADVAADEAIDTLTEHGIPASRHNSVGEAAEMAQVEARDVFTDVDHPRYGDLTLTDTPLRLSETETGIDRPAPLLGQHNREVLTEYGYTDEEIRALEEHGVLVSEDA